MVRHFSHAIRTIDYSNGIECVVIFGCRTGYGTMSANHNKHELADNKLWKTGKYEQSTSCLRSINWSVCMALWCSDKSERHEIKIINTICKNERWTYTKHFPLGVGRRQPDPEEVDEWKSNWLRFITIQCVAMASFRSTVAQDKWSVYVLHGNEKSRPIRKSARARSTVFIYCAHYCIS